MADEKDLEKSYSNKALVAKLRRLADALEEFFARSAFVSASAWGVSSRSSGIKIYEPANRVTAQANPSKAFGRLADC